MQEKTIEQLLPKDAAARLIAFRDAVAQALPGAVADIDVAVVLKDLSLNRDVRRRLADAAWEHVVEGYAIVPIALTADEFAADCPTRTELATRIAAEGVRVE